MKALVTGGTGFIGSHLCEALIKRGYEVTCLSRTLSNLKWIENLDVSVCTGDCTQIDTLSAAIEEADYIFHLAGLTKASSEAEFISVNATGTENLIRTVARVNPGLRRFVYLSSLAAAGPSPAGKPVREDVEPAPVSMYGRSKLEGERAVLRFSDTIPVTILRPPAIYGPRDRDMLVLIKMVKKGLFFDLGDGSYSLLYVDDLISGIVLAAEQSSAAGKTYFLSDSIYHSGKDIVGEICRVLDVKAMPVKVPKAFMPFFAFIAEIINKNGIINRDKIRELKHSHWICDAGRAREELGFIPKVRLKEGIKWTADWYRIHRWL